MTDINKLVGMDEHPENALDTLGIEYEVLEDIEWDDQGKYQYGSLVVQVGDQIFGIDVSRSGSYFSDYYYDIDSVTELKKQTTYTVSKNETFVALDCKGQDTEEVVKKAQEIIEELS